MNHPPSPAASNADASVVNAAEKVCAQLDVTVYPGTADFTDVQQRLRRHRDARKVREQFLMFAILLAPLLGGVALHWRHAVPLPKSSAVVVMQKSSALLPVAEDHDTAIYWTLGDVTGGTDSAVQSVDDAAPEPAAALREP